MASPIYLRTHVSYDIEVCLQTRVDRAKATSVNFKFASMVELVDTQVLGTCAARRGGSSPSGGTI